MEVGSYSSVPQDDSQNSQDGIYISRPKSRHFIQTFLLPFFTLCIGLFSGMLINEHWRRDFKSYGSYETGFNTESILPPNLIELEQKKFSGNVKFLSNGTEVLILDPLEPVYVGNPHPDIDLAWDKLLKGRYFSLSEEEAKKVWGPGYKVYMDRAEGGFTGGFDVFHSLHCLNQIRKALYPDYYLPTVFHGIEHTHITMLKYGNYNTIVIQRKS
ncbi:hypothetical protein FMUND_13539 [Fusarium mundagurra]|uniref:Uncharacterized protein n=1 Tax=Fusarium mundagurra TaxID=1567541 RepID=A0A8H5XYR5_9HYPO|nr:hypothetical protein FMUND_13539 [Fusarium mundagurra]